MQNNQDTQDSQLNPTSESEVSAPAAEPAITAPTENVERPRLKRNGVSDQFKKKGDEIDKENKPPMSKEDTIKFYEENLPFMRMQDEFEEIRFRFEERRIKFIELQVREVQAMGYLAEWKAGQDDANKRKEEEEKLKAEWDAMSDEEKEKWKAKAKANLRIMEMQAKGTVAYNGENAADILSFVTGEIPENEPTCEPDGKFCFMIPDVHRPGELTTLCVAVGQSVSRTAAGEFIVS